MMSRCELKALFNQWVTDCIMWHMAGVNHIRYEVVLSGNMTTEEEVLTKFLSGATVVLEMLPPRDDDSGMLVRVSCL